MGAAYAVLIAASASVYAALAVDHVLHRDSPDSSPTLVAVVIASIAVALGSALVIVRRRPADLAGWIGVIWWGAGVLLAVVAGSK